MDSDPWASSDQLKALIRQLDEAVRDAEQVRNHVERQMRSRTMWPDRREPRHWQQLPDNAPDSPPKA
jgi:hypothetical protein